MTPDQKKAKNDNLVCIMTKLDQDWGPFYQRAARWGYTPGEVNHNGLMRTLLSEMVEGVSDEDFVSYLRDFGKKDEDRAHQQKLRDEANGVAPKATPAPKTPKPAKAKEVKAGKPGAANKPPKGKGGAAAAAPPIQLDLNLGTPAPAIQLGLGLTPAVPPAEVVITPPVTVTAAPKKAKAPAAPKKAAVPAAKGKAPAKPTEAKAAPAPTPKAPAKKPVAKGKIKVTPKKKVSVKA